MLPEIHDLCALHIETHAGCKSVAGISKIVVVLTTRVFQLENCELFQERKPAIRADHVMVIVAVRVL